MIKLTFVGDVMLGRSIASTHGEAGSPILEQAIVERLSEADFVVGNLESPVLSQEVVDADHLQFKGDPKLLPQFSGVNCFVLANNHINDFGLPGMDETVHQLDELGIPWNGLYRESYKPHCFELKGKRFALFTCTDMMNEEIPSESPWQVPHVDDASLKELISEYRKNGYFVILYAHVGMLFSRYPNPPIRALMHQMVDVGAHTIVTVHSHVAGGMETYNNAPIFYSLGDFVMDGSSDRRRRSMILELSIDPDDEVSWDLVPVHVNQNLRTVIASGRRKRKMFRSWKNVSRGLERRLADYTPFFRKQYRIEMIQHIASTGLFLLKSKGARGLIRVLLKRSDEVKRLRKWTVQDRSRLRMDHDAIAKDRKRLSSKDVS